MSHTKEFVRIWNTVTEEYDTIEVTPEATEVVPVSPVEISQVVNETSSVTVVNEATVDQSTNQADVVVAPNVIDISQDNNVTLVDRSSNETAIINTTNETTIVSGPIAPPTASEPSGLDQDQVDARVDLKVPTGTKPAEWSLLATDEELTSGLAGKLDSSTVIPTKTSELTNDSGFLTSETDSYTKTEEDTLLADKVDKVSGEGLSQNNLTNALKTQYDAAHQHTSTSHFDGQFGNLTNVPANVTALENATNPVFVDTTYEVKDGELSQNNFTDGDVSTLSTAIQDISGKQDNITAGTDLEFDGDTLNYTGSAEATYTYFALRTVNGTTLQLEDNVTSIPAMIADGWIIIDGLTSDSIILTNDILQRSN